MAGMAPSRKLADSTPMAPRRPGPLGVPGANDFDFNLSHAKVRVFRDEHVSAPPNFKKFFNSATYDRLLQTVLLYFAAIFQTEWVVRTMERARKQHLDGYNPYVVAQRLNELQEETTDLRMAISPIYSEIIFKFSSYKQPQQDRMFFEALYSTLINLADEAFAKLQRRPDIERELGGLFRTKHFNLYERKNAPPRSVDSLTCKELYSIKHETSNRALNAKLLSSLFERPTNVGVQIASVSNSPLVSQYVMSPIVARAMMKDPEQRKIAMGMDTAVSSKKKVGTVFKSVAMMKGVNVPALQAEGTAHMSLPDDDAGDMVGLLGADKARKPDRKPGGRVAAVPEAAGLPIDDTFTYIVLLRRYVLYGPSMGIEPAGSLPTPNGAATAGRESIAMARSPGAGSKMLSTLQSVQRRSELDAVRA